MGLQHLLVLLSLRVLCILLLPHVFVFSLPLHSIHRSLQLGVNNSIAHGPSRVTQLSWHPRAFLYKGFLSEEECDHLIALAKGNLQKSMVADKETGESMLSKVRTSSGMFLSKAQDETIADIEARITAWTFLPAENAEPIHVLRYKHGEKYEPHFDYFFDEAHKAVGHRIATVLMYLSNVKQGGETVFPYAEARLSQPKDESWSECAKKGYAVKPNKGDALLFFSFHLDAKTSDFTSLHGSCAVIDGEKWSATKWIHLRDISTN